MGYHKAIITKGVLGQISKIQEELDELKDAENQNAKILMLCELSDLVGSINHYLKNNFPDITLYDLDKMATMTKKAFETGER